MKHLDIIKKVAQESVPLHEQQWQRQEEARKKAPTYMKLLRLIGAESARTGKDYRELAEPVVEAFHDAGLSKRVEKEFHRAKRTLWAGSDTPTTSGEKPGRGDLADSLQEGPDDVVWAPALHEAARAGALPAEAKKLYDSSEDLHEMSRRYHTSQASKSMQKSDSKDSGSEKKGALIAMHCLDIIKLAAPPADEAALDRATREFDVIEALEDQARQERMRAAIKPQGTAASRALARKKQKALISGETIPLHEAQWQYQEGMRSRMPGVVRFIRRAESHAKKRGISMEGAFRKLPGGGEGVWPVLQRQYDKAEQASGGHKKELFKKLPEELRRKRSLPDPKSSVQGKDTSIPQMYPEAHQDMHELSRRHHTSRASLQMQQKPDSKPAPKAGPAPASKDSGSEKKGALGVIKAAAMHKEAIKAMALVNRGGATVDVVPSLLQKIFGRGKVMAPMNVKVKGHLGRELSGKSMHIAGTQKVLDAVKNLSKGKLPSSRTERSLYSMFEDMDMVRELLGKGEMYAGQLKAGPVRSSGRGKIFEVAKGYKLPSLKG
jgi:hypothetical protein